MKQKKIAAGIFLFIFLASATLLCASCTLFAKACKEHSYGGWTAAETGDCYVSGREKRECEKCGYIDERATPPRGHAFGEKEIIGEATCAEEGEERRVCTDCGFVEVIRVAKTEHVPIKDESGADKTFFNEHVCGEEKKEWNSCSRCGEAIYRQSGQKVFWPHVPGEPTIDAEATCTEDGRRSRHCEYCDYVTAEEVIPASHRYEVESSYAATCVAAGRLAEVCTVCGDEKTTIIKPSGHSFHSYTVTKEPTCAEAGEQTASCIRCGVKDVRTVPKSDSHRWGDWDVVDHGNCLTGVNGERKRVCTLCGKDESTMYPYSHDYDEHILLCKVCGTESATGKFKYQTYKAGIRITEYQGSGLSKIRVPTSIDGKTVVAVHQNAFAGHTEAEFIWLPETLAEIGDGAFGGCTGLKELYIPRAVVSVGSGILAGCVSLERLVIPFVSSRRFTDDGSFDEDSLRTLGSFFGTRAGAGLVKVTQKRYGFMSKDVDYYIPAALKTVYVHGGYVGAEAFRNCSELTEIFVGAMCLKQTPAGADYVAFDGAQVFKYNFENCPARVNDAAFRNVKIDASLFYPTD